MQNISFLLEWIGFLDHLLVQSSIAIEDKVAKVKEWLFSKNVWDV